MCSPERAAGRFCSPGGATDRSQGWSAAQPLEFATPSTLCLSPRGATESCALPGLDSTRNAGRFQGFRFASPLATLGRPSGAAKAAYASAGASAGPDRPVKMTANTNNPHAIFWFGVGPACWAGLSGASPAAGSSSSGGSIELPSASRRSVTLWRLSASSSSRMYWSRNSFSSAGGRPRLARSLLIRSHAASMWS
jgi:hypothetical protein